ncbi:hypothetical protein HOG98_07290 [bacterium]|jgi:pyruvate-formate lyase|nr:hypothetical protein [bacterium]
MNRISQKQVFLLKKVVASTGPFGRFSPNTTKKTVPFKEDVSNEEQRHEGVFEFSETLRKNVLKSGTVFLGKGTYLKGDFSVDKETHIHYLSKGIFHIPGKTERKGTFVLVNKKMELQSGSIEILGDSRNRLAEDRAYKGQGIFEFIKNVGNVLSVGVREYSNGRTEEGAFFYNKDSKKMELKTDIDS